MNSGRIEGFFSRPWGRRLVSAAVLVATFGIFTYRGWNARNRLMYLDEIFIEEALRPTVIYFRGFTDAFGETVFLHPFSGYLHTVVRAMTELILLGPLTNYPTWTFLFSTTMWTLSAWLIFLAVRNVAGQIPGVLVALSFALLHASNLILLGQLNAVQWPMLVACVITIILDYRPRTRLGMITYPILLVATSLNAALAFIPIALLGWRVLALPRRKQWRDAVHFLLMTVPFTLQLLTYYGQQIRTVDGRNPWWYMWREISYIPALLLPGSLRGSTQEVLSGWSLALLLALAAILVLTMISGVMVSARSHRKTTRILLELVFVAISASIISVYFNGNLNHQYVLIPFVSVWTAIIISMSSLLRRDTLRHWGQAAAFGAVFIFVFSSVGLWKGDFQDSFFGNKPGIDLREAIKSARHMCINKESDEEVFLTGYSILLPCEVISGLR